MYVTTHLQKGMDIDHISFLAALAQYSRQCNLCLKKSRVSNQSSKKLSRVRVFYTGTLRVRERQKSSKAVYNWNLMNGRNPALQKQECQFLEWIWISGFWRYPARNPVVSALCLPFPGGNSRLCVIFWTKEKSEKSIWMSTCAFQGRNYDVHEKES